MATNGASDTSHTSPAHKPGLALSDYDYTLPDHRIAIRPAAPRDSARMLLAAPEGLSDRTVADLPNLLAPGDRLVVNDSRVIPARLAGQRHRDGNVATVELTLLTEEAGTWTAFAKPAKRLQAGDTIVFGAVTGEVLTRQGPEVTVRFDASPLPEGAQG